MQVVNFIQNPTDGIKSIIYEIFVNLPICLKFVCHDNECVCEIRDSYLLFKMPVDIYQSIERFDVHFLLRLGFFAIGTEPFHNHNKIYLVIRFDYDLIPQKELILIKNRNCFRVNQRVLRDILLNNFLWISRFIENIQKNEV